MYSRSNGSSVIAFIIVSLMLVAAVIGGIIFARNRSETVRGPVVEVAQNDEQQKDGTEESADSGTDKNAQKTEEDTNKDSDSDKKTDSSDSTQKDDSKKEEQGASGDTPSATEGDSDSSSEENTQNDSSDSSSSAEQDVTEPGTTPMAREQQSNPGSLPQTGPADMLTTVVGLVALCSAGYVYYHFGRK